MKGVESIRNRAVTTEAAPRDCCDLPELVAEATPPDNKSTHHTKRPELRSCVEVEVDVLGSPVGNKPTVCVDVQQHFNQPSATHADQRSQELHGY